MPSPNPKEQENCSVYDALGSLYTCYSKCGPLARLNREPAFRHQMLNYYRYGTANECVDKWDDLKFCLKIKTKPEQVKKQMIVERNAEKSAKLAERPNSTQVWELRDKVSFLIQLALTGLASREFPSRN